VYDWYSCFKSGQELLENDPCSGRPSIAVNAERISKVKVLMRANQWITVKEVVKEVGISYGSPQAILTKEVQMRWDETSWILHLDNAASHTAMAMQQFLAGEEITLMVQQPYMPDLAPCDFWLFPRLKMGLLGQCFVTLDIKCMATAGLHTIPKEAFHECFQAWQNCWSKCVCIEEMHFEDV
jgi:hypothetical protein